MKKLKLNLDELKVESFVIGGSFQVEKGTVRGNIQPDRPATAQPGCISQVQTVGCATCDYSCGGTCQTCPNPTCNNTCYFTCAGQPTCDLSCQYTDCNSCYVSICFC